MSTSPRSVRLTILLLAAVVPVTAALGQEATPAAATQASPGAAHVRAATPPSPKTKTVPVGSNPYDVALSQLLGEAFVVNDGSVTVLSLSTHRQLAELATGGQNQNSVALVARDTRAYITDYDNPDVLVLDTETRRMLPPIPVGSGAVDVATVDTPDGERAYVAYNDLKQLTGITASTSKTPPKVSQHVTLPRPAQTVTAAPGGTHVWAGSTYDGHVFVVDTHSGKVTKSIDVGPVGPVASIAFSPDGKRAWVAGAGGLGVLDAMTGKTVKFLPIASLFTGEAPNMGPVALTGSGRYAYVENSTFPDSPARGEIAMLDTTSYRVVHHIPTGKEPEALSIDTRRNTAYVPNYAADTLTYFPTEK